VKVGQQGGGVSALEAEKEDQPDFPANWST